MSCYRYWVSVVVFVVASLNCATPTNSMIDSQTHQRRNLITMIIIPSASEREKLSTNCKLIQWMKFPLLLLQIEYRTFSPSSPSDCSSPIYDENNDVLHNLIYSIIIYYSTKRQRPDDGKWAWTATTAVRVSRVEWSNEEREKKEEKKVHQYSNVMLLDM